MVGPLAAIRPEGPLLRLSHCRSHDYKLLIQKGRDGGYRGRQRAHQDVWLHVSACDDQPHDGIIQLANIEGRKEGEHVRCGRLSRLPAH